MFAPLLPEQDFLRIRNNPIPQFQSTSTHFEYIYLRRPGVFPTHELHPLHLTLGYPVSSSCVRVEEENTNTERRIV